MVAGPFAGTTEWFAHHLHSTFGFESLGHFEHHFDWATAILGTLAALGGIALSYIIYGKDEISITLPNRLRPLYEASLNKFYVDDSMNGSSAGRLVHLRWFATSWTPISWMDWRGELPGSHAGWAEPSSPGIRTG